MKLWEMTLTAGSLDLKLGKYLSIYAKSFPVSYEHLGDIEEVAVWFDKATSIYLLVKDKLIGWFYVIGFKTTMTGLELKAAYVLPDLRSNRLFEKFIWFLKKHVIGGSCIMLGDVHSEATQHVVKKLAHAERFELSWFNIDTTERVAVSDNMLLGYSALKATPWRIIIENDGDFSTWPKFYTPDHADIKQWYDFLLEHSSKSPLIL